MANTTTEKSLQVSVGLGGATPSQVMVGVNFSSENGFNLKGEFEPKAANIEYDNTNSGLKATNVQAGIDELARNKQDKNVEVFSKISELALANITANGFFGVTYGDGRYVAVSGGIYTWDNISYSVDGENWSVAGSVGFVIKKIVYGNGRFVAVGNGIATFRFNEDNTLEMLSTNTDITCVSVAYGNGKFVIYDNAGKIYSSEDAITWTDINFPHTTWNPTLNDKMQVIYGDGKFIVNAGIEWVTSNAQYTHLSYSEDLVNWSEILVYDYYLEKIAYGNGRFVAVGAEPTTGTKVIVHSEDLNAWGKSDYSNQNNIYGIGNGNLTCFENKFIAVGSGGLVICSDDGITWGTIENTVFTNTLRDGIFANNLIVVVGDSTICYAKYTGETKTIVEALDTLNNMMSDHIENTDNPHNVTAEQVGADAKGSADEALSNAKSYTDTKIADLINGAPETLDTLKEIAEAMTENEDVVEALNASIGTKANASDLTAHTSNKSNPHGVTKSQVGLGNVPNVATNDQKPTYTANSTLTALTSGEKLSVAFGKIAKAVSDLISHIANKSNPHEITVSQIGAAAASHTHAQADITGLVKKVYIGKNGGSIDIQTYYNGTGSKHAAIFSVSLYNPQSDNALVLFVQEGNVYEPFNNTAKTSTITKGDITVTFKTYQGHKYITIINNNTNADTICNLRLLAGDSIATISVS